MNGILASVFTPTQTIICIVAAIVVAALIVTNVVVAYFFNKRGERKLYDKLLQQEREILMQQLRNMNVGANVDKDNVEGVINAVQDSEKYAASEEKTISDLRNIISSAAEKYEVVTKISAPEAIAVAVPPIQAVPVVDSASEPEKPEEPIAETAAEEEEEDDLTLADFADEETEEVEVVVTETGRVLRYNRSFTSRLIQGGDVLQARYTELKNYLLSYKKVKSRISWKRDSFHCGRQTVATFAIRGKTLCLCLATEPNQYEETKYKVKDLRIRSPKTKTPLLYQIRNERRVGYAKDLIDRMMGELGIERLAEAATEDYRLPYETTEALIERELIKVMGEGGTPFGGIAHAEETLPEPEKSEEPVAEMAAEEEEEDDAMLADFADEETEEVEVVVTETGRVLRYNRSFTSRLIQGGDVLQARYTELKNYLLSYKKVKSRISWKRDSFHCGRQTVATFAIRGKTLCLCLATEPNQYEETKYKVKDLRIRSPKTKTPLLYQIRNERRVGYAKDLIDRMMEELGIERLAEAATEDYRLPYETTETLIERELIKVMGEGGTPFGGIAHVEETLSEPEKFEKVVAEQPVPEDTQEETVSEAESQPEEAEPIAEETLFEEPFSPMTIEDEDDTPVLEIFPEEAAEEVVAAEAAPVPEEEEPEEQVEAEEIPLAVLFSENEEENEDAAEIVVTETGNVVRYNVSLTAYVAQGDEGLKARYSALKNCIFSFRGVRNKVYWKRESFRKGKVSLATIVVRGETLCLCLNADPARYANTKYKVEDLSLTSKNTKTPLLYRVQTDRRLDYAKQLIETVFAEHGLVRIEHDSVDYAELYSTTEELIARGLIRVIDDAESAASKK